VITGFGRLGKPFASQRFGVEPDLFTTAKGLTNGTVPMGAVFVRDSIYDAFMQGTDGIELFHGYTYSGHPVACAAGIGTLDTYAEEDLLTRGSGLDKYWEDAAHALKGTRHVIDIRNCGLIAAIELEPREGAPGRRAYEAFVRAFESGVLIRVTGDIIALSPPLIVEKPQIDRLFQSVREVLQTVS
jgi:beta-alanine--pyruvate transaminase